MNPTRVDFDVLTIRGIAELAGVKTDTILMWATTGKLPFSRTSRGWRVFERTTVERFLIERAAMTAAQAEQAAKAVARCEAARRARDTGDAAAAERGGEQ